MTDNTIQSSDKLFQAFTLLFWASLLVLAIFYVASPIYDPDFWWHLKTGDLIIQQKSLLKIDPFNFTGDIVVRSREAVILNGYWLWQITASALYGFGGFYGIFFLKFITMALLACTLFFEMSRQSVTRNTQIILTGMGAVIFITVYALERPQVFSVIFITTLLGMIARIRLGDKPNIMLFPLMILWSNIHGGFVVGDILLALAASGFIIQYRNNLPLRNRLIAWAIAGIVSSFINPNGWAAFVETFNFMQHSPDTRYVIEYQSSWHVFKHQSSIVGFVFFIAALHITSLILAKPKFWPEILISFFIIGFGLAYIRNAGFIAISMLPMTAWYLDKILPENRHKLKTYLQAALCTGLLFIICWITIGKWQDRKSATWPVSSFFPENIPVFLKKSGITGNLFNDYTMGGYLDWALYPERKTFIDGRGLDTRVFEHYLSICGASSEIVEGKPKYQLLLDRYSIEIIALPLAMLNGRLQPILKHLLNNAQWIPVFLDSQSFVLVRATEKNSMAINNFKINKILFIENMTKYAKLQHELNPDIITVTTTFADVLMYAGKLREAEILLNNMETMHPGADILVHLKRQYTEMNK